MKLRKWEVWEQKSKRKEWTAVAARSNAFVWQSFYGVSRETWRITEQGRDCPVPHPTSVGRPHVHISLLILSKASNLLGARSQKSRRRFPRLISTRCTDRAPRGPLTAPNAPQWVARPVPAWSRLKAQSAKQAMVLSTSYDNLIYSTDSARPLYYNCI